MRVAILGAGRMGQALLGAIDATPDVEVAGVWARSGRIAGEYEAATTAASANLAAVLQTADVAVDFTLPTATEQVLDEVLRQQVPLVCGVTGLDEGLIRQLDNASRTIALLYDRNMSVGIAVLTELVGNAAGRLGPDFLASIHETHHQDKKDAPSGTALHLGAALARARNQSFRDVYRFSTGNEAPRCTRDDIVITAERRGNVPGEHYVCLASPSERLMLSHAVTDRRVFADGALRAAAWLINREPGLYALRDVICDDPGGGGAARVTVK